MAGCLLGWRTVCAVENDPGARQIILDRQRDGALPRFPIWDDVRTFDGTPWRGHVDVITCGFPCQDIANGGTCAGIEGERSGLWADAARTICDIRPKLVVVENSPNLTIRGMGRVLRELATMGMDAKWGVFRASTIGACHHRSRLFMVAYPDGKQLEGLDLHLPEISDPYKSRRRQLARAVNAALPADDYASMPRDPDVLARGMDGLKATGNGWVPPVAARAIKVLLSK